MKKFFALFLILVTVLTLAACSADKAPDTSDTAEDPSAAGSAADSTVSSKPAASEQSAGDAEVEPKKDKLPMSDVFKEKVVISSLVGEERQTFLDECEKEGIKVDFNADGSTVIIYPDGTKAVQSSDGTTKIDDSDLSATIAGSWADSELGGLLPEPDFGTLQMVGAESGSYAAQIAVTADDMDAYKAYIGKLKGAGFTKGIVKTDNAFYASNGEGYSVSAVIDDSMCMIGYTKAE